MCVFQGLHACALARQIDTVEINRVARDLCLAAPHAVAQLLGSVAAQWFRGRFETNLSTAQKEEMQGQQAYSERQPLAEGAQTDLWWKLARLVQVVSIHGHAERQACGKTGTSP